MCIRRGRRHTVLTITPTQTSAQISTVPTTGPEPPRPMSSVSSSSPLAHGRVVSTDNKAPPGGSVRDGVPNVTCGYTLSAPILNDNRSLTNGDVSPAQKDGELSHLYPDFLPKRIVPGRYMVVPRELGHGLLMGRAKEKSGVNASRGDLSARRKMRVGNKMKKSIYGIS